MILEIISVSIASIISGVLYRLGGSQYYHTLWRDIGCSLISTILIGYLVSWHWTLILVFGMTWGALTTYWKVGPKAYWFNWIFTGLGYSLAVLPFCIAEGHWIGFGIRTVVLSLTTMIWSELNGNAILEEFGRGFLLSATIPLLLI